MTIPVESIPGTLIDPQGYHLGPLNPLDQVRLVPSTPALKLPALQLKGGLIGDLQSGSYWALWHPELKQVGLNVVGLNPLQEYLWEKWESDFWPWLDQYAPLDFIVWGGDLFEGQQPKEGGRSLTAISRTAQKQNLKLLIGRHRHSALRHFVLQGSRYHESADDCEEIADWLRAEVNPETGGRTWLTLWLNVEGKLINFYHESAVSVGFYVTTALERENMWSTINSDKLIGQRTDLNVRFHRHQKTSVQHSSTGIVEVPGWQGQTEYELRKPRSVYRMVPEIGSSLLIVQPYDVTEPFRLKHKKYALPHRPIIDIHASNAGVLFYEPGEEV